MIDITKILDWNNYKTMSMQRLVEEFMKLSLSQKIKVYRYLPDKRKRLLRKGYEEFKSKRYQELRRNNIKYLLLPLGGYLDSMEIKNDSEYLLTLGIILYDSNITDFLEESDPNYNKEEESFNKTRNKLIKWLDLFDARQGLFFRENELIKEIEQVKYISPQLKLTFLSFKKERWSAMYQYIGVGKERANRISIELLRRMKELDGLSYEEYEIRRLKYYKWKNVIPQRTQEEALKYLQITEFNTFDNN